MSAEDLPKPRKGAASFHHSFEEIEKIVLLSTGFVLVPIEVPGPDLARALGEGLTAEGHPTILFEPLDDEAWARLASNLRDIAPSSPDVVMVIGGRDLSRGMDLGLHLVNQSRDSIAGRIGRPLLWCGPRPFLERTMDEAPDFWSIRALERRLVPDAAPPPAEAPGPGAREQAPSARPAPSAQAARAAKASPAMAPGSSPEAVPRLEAAPGGLEPSQHPDLRARLELVLRELAANVLNAAILSRAVIEELLARDDVDAAEALLARTFPPIADLSHPTRSDLAILRAKIQHRRGMLGDALATLAEVLTAPALRDDQRVTAQLALAGVERDRGDTTHAEEVYREALTGARAAQDGASEARALVGLSSLLLQGNPLDGAALVLLEEADGLAKALGDPDLRSLTRHALARAYSAAYDERRAKGLPS